MPESNASFRVQRLALFAVVGLLAVQAGLQLGCSKSSTTAVDATATAAGEAPMPIVRPESENLLFSFLDPTGRVQAVPRVDAVPEPVRARVLVVDLSKTPEERQAHRYAFFADLTAPRPDGTYPVSVVSRYNAADASAAAPSGLAPPQNGEVLVYSAVWCGFCKKAKAWLTAHDVAFIERDVEKTPGAQAELTEKLRKVGATGGGIPVIDWGGSLVMGFDEASLQRLLNEHAADGRKP
jgi:glutaredoxin